jgi:hypothetical protein
MSVVAELMTDGRSPLPQLGDILNREIRYDVEEDNMVVWDKGVFLNELQRQGIVLATNSNGSLDGSVAANAGLKQGTYKGTQMALTEIYSLVEEAYGHFAHLHRPTH